MHSIINYTSPRPPQEVASAFYQHPYGGTARDIWVSREGFARFFEDSVECVDLMGLINRNTKSYDVVFDNGEALGYILQDRADGPISYRITIINRGFNPWKDACDPHGIPRAEIAGWTTFRDIPTGDQRDPIIWGDYKGPPEDY